MKKEAILLITLILFYVEFLSGCEEKQDKFVGTWTDQLGEKWIFLDNGSLLWFGYLNRYYKVENNHLYIGIDSNFSKNNTEIWEYKFHNDNTVRVKNTIAGITYTLFRN